MTGSPLGLAAAASHNGRATQSASSGETALAVEGVTVRFDGIVALDGASFSVQPSQICGLIGPNGAGKTTLFNCVSRIYTPQQGTIVFNGIDILRRQRREIVDLGIARTFQNLGLYPTLTILENVLIGAHRRMNASFMGSALWLSSLRQREAALVGEARNLLAQLGLDAVIDQRPGELPFGTLKRAELARALMSRPKLLMLDEPANGLAHAEVDELAERILALKREFQFAILLVEHHMGMVSAICDHVVVLDLGRKIAEGTPAAVSREPAVMAAYLGRTT